MHRESPRRCTDFRWVVLYRGAFHDDAFVWGQLPKKAVLERVESLRRVSNGNLISVWVGAAPCGEIPAGLRIVLSTKATHAASRRP